MGIKKKHSQGVEQFADSHNTQANATPQDDIITLEGQMSLFDAPPLKVHNKVRLDSSQLSGRNLRTDV